MEVAYARVDTFATTPDGLHYIGSQPGLPHTFFALGYGNGITYSLTAARILHDQRLGCVNRQAHLFRLSRQRSP